MPSFLQPQALLALLAISSSLISAQSGKGTTTRYWDCCKPSCAWPGKDGITSPVKTCNINDQPLSDSNIQSGCAGGSAYMCSDQSPWAVSDDLAYGFAAVSTGNPSCCACYQLTFTSGPVKGKKMVVQATNTGSDVGQTQFDLAIPGGGFGMFDGCSKEWGATSAIWGAQYGGPSSNTCPSFPKALQPGCGFRWGWMKGADNPTVDFEPITCPAAIVAKSGCSRPGYKSHVSPTTPTTSPSTPKTTSTPTKQSTSTKKTSTSTRRPRTRRTTTSTRKRMAPTKVAKVVVADAEVTTSVSSRAEVTGSVTSAVVKPVETGTGNGAEVDDDDTCEN